MTVTTPRPRRPRPAAALAAAAEAGLDAELLGLLGAAGGRATLPRLFDRDPSWAAPAPRWAADAALRLARAGLVACDPAGTLLTLTPAGLRLAPAGR